MSRRTINPLLVILVVSVVCRVAVAFYLGDTVPTNTDETSYSALGMRLATGHGYSFDRGWYPFTPADAPTSHWSFLYSAVVAGIYLLFGPHPLAARLVGAVTGGLLTPWLVLRLARRLFPGRSDVHLVSAACAAIYLYFVLYAAMIMTETLYIAALLWSLERALALAVSYREPCAQRERRSVRIAIGLELGAALGGATLLRQSILPWTLVLFAWLLWSNLRARRTSPGPAGSGWVSAVSPLVTAGVVMVLCVLPFTVRNYRAYGQFLLLNSNAGYAMYAAQHPMHGTSFREYTAAPLPEDLIGSGLNEAQWDRELLQRGIGFVLADPIRYLRLSLSRVADYFEFWPTADTSLLHNVGRVGSIGVFLPFMAWGIWRTVRSTWRLCGRRLAAFAETPVFLVAAFMVIYALMHIFTWAMGRYRLPVDAVALPFAAVALLRLASRITAAHGDRQVA